MINIIPLFDGYHEDRNKPQAYLHENLISMKLTVMQSQSSPIVEEFAERFALLNLVHYATEAIVEMDFESFEELHESVKRAMEICMAAEIPIKGNFLRVYKSYSEGITYDWKLSPLAYKLVCISGNPSNPNVAQSTIQLIKNEHLNHL